MTKGNKEHNIDGVDASSSGTNIFDLNEIALDSYEICFKKSMKVLIWIRNLCTRLLEKYEKRFSLLKSSH